MSNVKTLLLIALPFFLLQCKKQDTITFLYETDQLTIRQVSEHSYVHVSYLQTDDFGKVACNGMIVLHEEEALVVDTPTDSSASSQLIAWLENEKKATIKAVVVTHFHEDCLGGLNVFHQHEIPSYANELTAQLAQKEQFPIPQNLFKKRLDLQIGSAAVINQYFGKGHTTDNMVSYFPTDQVLFGGCLVKAIGVTKGFIGDASLSSWSPTIAKIQSEYPAVKHVIPGHGAVGDQALLDYTRTLFDLNQTVTPKK